MAKHPKRPKDPVSRAVQIGRILVGDEKEQEQQEVGDPKAKAAGAKGGAARARSLSRAQRSKIAQKAAVKRWGNKD